MRLTVDQYRVCIGLFKVIFRFEALIRQLLNFNFSACFITIVSSCNRGILRHILSRWVKELLLSVCHWNLNSIWVKDFSNLSPISALLNVHQFDIFCLTKTFLGSSILLEDPRLALEGHKHFRCDHPYNLRRGKVCLYFNDNLPLALRPVLTTLNGVSRLQNLK